MYLWVVLATFMVALLSFNLSIRPDADRSLMETKAQTIITKFRAQHYAFVHFIASKRLTLTQIHSEGRDYVDYVSGVGYNDGRVLGTLSDAIRVQDIKNYLPYGFQTDPTIYSKVFCFKPKTFEADENYTTTCENDPDISSQELRNKCCGAAGANVIVVSWQPMPARWTNHANNKPLSDMMAVITRSEGYGSTFGFITNVDSVDGPVMSGGMYRTLGEERDAAGNLTGKYIHEIRYKPVYHVLEEDDDFQMCLPTRENGKTIQPPCLIAINKVSNREEN